MAETALDKRTIIAELTKSPHGDLVQYLTGRIEFQLDWSRKRVTGSVTHPAVAMRAADEDPMFFAHLIAWNAIKGQVRDAHSALPVVALAAMKRDEQIGTVDERQALTSDYAENAVAHLALLDPWRLRKAVLDRTVRERDANGQPIKPAKSRRLPPFVQQAHAPMRVIRRLVTRYLRELEADRGRFEWVAMRHHNTLAELYAHYHVSRPAWVGQILFHGEKGSKAWPADGSVFGVIRRLHTLMPAEAAGLIRKYRIPFVVASGALGKKATESDALQALIDVMTPNELTTNAKWLSKSGVKAAPALRGAMEAALVRAAESTKGTLKTSVAAEALGDDDVLAEKLKALQEKQLDKLGGIEGDWLVMGDKSGSMSASIDTAKEIAATLARVVKGKVHLIFFDQSPTYFDVTGKSLEDIKKLTRAVSASGGTSFGCALQYMLDRNLSVDGIVAVSDGGENQPPYFADRYKRYVEVNGTEPTVYLYHVDGDDNAFTDNCAKAGIDVTRFDLQRKKVDYYALPNLVQTMRVARYSLLDEIMATDLLTLDKVLPKTAGMAVLPKESVHA